MSRRMVFIVGVLTVTALVSSSCSSDDEESSSTSEALATDEMLAAVQAVIALGVDSSAPTADLSSCPLGDFDGLVGKAPDEVQALATSGDQLFAYVYQPHVEGAPRHLQCGRGELGAYTGETPDVDYRQDVVQQLEDFVVNFDDDRSYRGGTIVRFCTEVIGVGGGEFCEADWYDENVWVGVFIAGDGRSSELAEQWLIAVLDDVVANVPRLAPTLQLAN